MNKKSNTATGKTLAALDWIAGVILLLFGLFLIVSEWPHPSVWSWVLFGSGVVGIPLAYFNPMGALRMWMLRRLVKRR